MKKTAGRWRVRITRRSVETLVAARCLTYGGEFGGKDVVEDEA